MFDFLKKIVMFCTVSLIVGCFVFASDSEASDLEAPLIPVSDFPLSAVMVDRQQEVDPPQSDSSQRHSQPVRPDERRPRADDRPQLREETPDHDPRHPGQYAPVRLDERRSRADGRPQLREETPDHFDSRYPAHAPVRHEQREHASQRTQLDSRHSGQYAPVRHEQRERVPQRIQLPAEQFDTAYSVGGTARVGNRDYIENYFRTEVYQEIGKPHRELYNQMQDSVLDFLRNHQTLVVDFEVASKDFAETVGPGISSAMYPSCLQTYKRLADASHPIAMERYADHLIFAAQVKTDRDMICEICCLCCAKCSVEEMCETARKNYGTALNKYKFDSSHRKLLQGKYADAEIIGYETRGQYINRFCAYFLPPALIAGGMGVFYYLMMRGDL